MKKILVPFDFSEYAEMALDFAIQISKKAQSEIHLVHVLEYPVNSTFHISGEIVPEDPMDKIFMMQLIERTNTKLEGVLTEVPPEILITTKVMIGNPYEGITMQIEHIKADLIVMGTKGASGLKELLIGSNTEKVVRNATCPVISLHQKANLDSINSVVFASDLSDELSLAMATFKPYQSMFNASIHLVWIASPHDPVPKDTALNRLNQIASTLQLENYDTHIGTGYSIENGIIEYAEEINANMIAMSTHSYKGLMHFFFGSTAENAVNHTSKPVWTYSVKNASNK